MNKKIIDEYKEKISNMEEMLNFPRLTEDDVKNGKMPRRPSVLGRNFEVGDRVFAFLFQDETNPEALCIQFIADNELEEFDIKYHLFNDEHGSFFRFKKR